MLMRTKKTETALHNTMPRRYAGKHECSESTDPVVDAISAIHVLSRFFFPFFRIGFVLFVCLFFVLCCFVLFFAFFFCSHLSLTTITT